MARKKHETSDPFVQAKRAHDAAAPKSHAAPGKDPLTQAGGKQARDSKGRFAGKLGGSLRRADYGKWATAGGRRLFGSLEQAAGRARAAGKSHRAAPSESNAKAYKAAREHVRRVKELAIKAEQVSPREKTRPVRSAEERRAILAPLKTAHAAAQAAHASSPTAETSTALAAAHQKLRAARSEAGSSTPEITPEHLHAAAARLKAAHENFRQNFVFGGSADALAEIQHEHMRALGDYETTRKAFYTARVRMGGTEVARAAAHANLDQALAGLGPIAAERHERWRGDVEDDAGNTTPSGRYRAAKSARDELQRELREEHTLSEDFKENAHELHRALNPAFDKPAVRAGVRTEQALADAKIRARLDELIPLPEKPPPRTRKSK